jgi:nucleotide-binding universal stress UspA family protein
MTKTIILVIPSAEGLDEAAARAAREAGEGGRVVVAWLADTELHDRLSARMTDQGFVGLGPSQDVMRSLRESQDDQGATLLEEAAAAVAAAGATTELRTLKGTVEEAVPKLATELAAHAVVIPTPRRRRLARLLGEPLCGSRLERALGVPLIRVEY